MPSPRQKLHLVAADPNRRLFLIDTIRIAHTLTEGN